MIQITKEQSEFLRANGVKEGITRTSRQCSHRHIYWCAEDRYILALLDEFAGSVEREIDYKKEREESRDF